jgi:hypothetical protein
MELGAQSVRMVLYVASVLLVCLLSIAAMVWLPGERISIAPLSGCSCSPFLPLRVCLLGVARLVP